MLSSEEYLKRFEELKNDDSFQKTKKLIEEGRKVRNIVKKNALPSGDQCDSIKEYFLAIENWKYGMESDDCEPYYERHLNKNCPASIVGALAKVHRSIARSESDKKVLSHLNRLIGMGSVKEGNDNSSARQKMASSVLRLVYPEKYGVVDWRVAAVLFEQNGTGKQFRKKYDVIDAKMAENMFKLYRKYSSNVLDGVGKTILPGDIETILFYLSLERYPVQNA